MTSQAKTTTPLAATQSTRDLVRRACLEWGVPSEHAEEAMAITVRRIPWDGDAPLRSARRREAYFWGVLRRRVLRSQGEELRPLRARFALASVAQDLREAGFDESAVHRRLSAECPDVLAEAGVALGQLRLAG
jgi:hypothetical protein